MDEIIRPSEAIEPDHPADRPAPYEQRVVIRPQPGHAPADPVPVEPVAAATASATGSMSVAAPVPAPVPVPAAAGAAAGLAPVPVPAPAHAGAAGAAGIEPGVAALLRLAVVCVDPDGRISYWNRGAEELFGHRWENVFGHRASGLLTAMRPNGGNGPHPGPAAQHPDALDLLDDLTSPAWAGALAATDRDGAVRDVLWWTYRLVEPAGRSLLVLAAHAKPLRTGGLRIALGGRMLPYTAEGPQRQDIAVSAVLAPGGPAPAIAPASRLGGVLPGVSPGRLDRVVRQIATLGAPALTVDGGMPLPVVPYDIATAAPAARTAPGRRHALLPGQRPDGPTTAGDAEPPAGRTPDAAGPAADPPQGAAGPAPADSPSPLPPAADLTSAAALTAVPPTGSAAAPLSGNALDEQLALLHATGATVGSTLDLNATARELCAVTVPRFADVATVVVVDQLFSDTEPHKDDRPSDTVSVRRVAVAHHGRAAMWENALPEGELMMLSADQIVPRAGTAVLVPVVDPALAADIALDLGVPALGRPLAGHSLIVTPLTARGTVLGRMCFLRGPGRRPFDERDAATATEVAARGAVHIDNARLHRQESRAAATLQRSMMPTRPPRLPGVRIAHHYMPGDRQAQVGGDWFDAIQLPGGRVALVVGDVMGHGLQAAAVMGQFRTAVITMAALDLPPAQLLRHLDNLAQRLGTDHLATCVYAVYDPVLRTLTLANAGHIPPVLAGHDGRSELLEIPGGAPIGVGGVPFETVEIPAPDGSWLVLCTDGLVEVRGQGIDAGLAALCSHVIEPQHTPEDVCAQILGRVHSEDRRDDVALLVAKFEGIAPQDVVRWALPLEDAQVAVARARTRRQLALWGLERLSDTAELLVSELVTNAIRAASRDVELRLMRVGKLMVEVSDDNHNLPQLQRADADDEEGRGLALVSHLAPRWGTSRKAVGKVVWFELPLPS